jgi:uncharacterized protein involved in exopolysaccharide biosynthesis
MKSTDRESAGISQAEDEIDLREVFLLLWNNRYVIGAISFGFAFVAALVSFLILTPQYESSAVIMPARSGGSGAGLSALANQSGLGAFLNLAGGDQEVSRFVEILNSRDLAEKVLSEEQMLKFIKDPREIPEPGTREYREARERLLEKFQKATNVQNQGNIIRLSFENASPELSAETVELYLQGLQNFIEKNLTTQAKRTEVFVEERLAEAEASLRHAETAYLDLQKEEGVVALPSQVSLALNTASQIRSQMIEKEMEIDLLKSIMKDSSEIQRLESEKSQLEAQLKKIISGKDGARASKSSSPDILTPLNKSSGLQFQFANVEREYFIKTKIIELLTQQLEIAKIETKKNEPAFQIIDSPKVAVFPSSPNKKLNTALGFVLGFILSAFAVLILNQFQRLPPYITRVVHVNALVKKSSEVAMPHEKKSVSWPQ